ncbi:MAG: DNA topoisomerase III, partial [Burkholderiales bacterium]|nr:DNA topoisomerase III [Burkholderiales bacterium]
MGKTLVIAEKPSVAADIAKALGGVKKVTDYYEGDDYVIASAVGHLLEIKAPEEYEVQRGKWNLDNLPVIPPYFDLEPIKKTEARLKSLAKLIKRKDVDKIINACDAGREGELIFRYIIDSVKTKKTLERLWLQSMTKQSILSAFQHLRTDAEMKNLADAAKSRSEADWLVGINGTRAMTAFNSQGRGFFLTTVGRVQTPTLALVVKREAEIQGFKPKDYWEVHADFAAASGLYPGRYINPDFKKDPKDPFKKADRLWNAEDAQAIVDKCKNGHGVVTEESKPTTSSCPALYDLTSLQRDANNRFGFSAKTTLSIAQALYEKHKVLTYPRTDARALPNDYVPTVKDTMRMLQQTQWSKFATEVLDNNWVKPVKKIFDNSKISDHFAIIPTTQTPPASLSDVEQKIYDLVVKRFLAVFFPPAQYKQITRKTIVSGYTFLSEGKVLQSPGWLAVYGRGAGNPDELLVPITDGEKVAVHTIEAEKLATKPPARYTEATLLSAMENAGKEVTEEEYRLAMSEKGIGTPATRAAIIDGLKVQGYMILEGRDLVPTAKAKQLLTLLKGLDIKELSDAELTGEWEYQLGQIEKGKLTRSEFMKEIGTLTKDIVQKARNHEKDATVPLTNPARLKVPCPCCGGPIDEQYNQYVCSKCGWHFSKQPGGRILEPSEAEELIANKKIGPLEGFISKTRRPFSASLKLVVEGSDYKIDFDFGEKPEVVVDMAEVKKGKPVGTCPVCKKHQVFETENAYACEAYLDPKASKKCTFRSSKVILQQPIEREQMKKLLETGSTDLLTDFVSNRTKRKFSASLILEKGGKIGFK